MAADRVYPLEGVAEEGQKKRFEQALRQHARPTPIPLYRPPRKGRNPCCRCFCCVCATLATLLLALIVAAAILYILLQPKAPNFSVTKAYITEFNLTTEPIQPNSGVEEAPIYLQTDVNFTVQAGNPNKEIGIYYDEIDVGLYYEGVEIGTGSLPSVYLGHKESKEMQLQLRGKDTPLVQGVGSGLQKAVGSGSSIWLQVKTVTHARIQVWGWKSRDAKVRVNCDVQISNPEAGRGTQLLSKSCKLKLVNVWL